MAYVYEQISTDVPAVIAQTGYQSIQTAHDSTNGTAPAGPRFAQGESTQLRPHLNELAMRVDLAASIGGGGLTGVAAGLAITQNGGLTTATIAPGQATINGLVELSVGVALALSPGWNRFWLLQDRTVAKTVNTIAPPTGGVAGAFLGAVNMGSADIDLSGVCFIRGSAVVRRTADANEPADTPPATTVLYGRTTGGLYLWDGVSWSQATVSGAVYYLSTIPYSAGDPTTHDDYLPEGGPHVTDTDRTNITDALANSESAQTDAAAALAASTAASDAAAAAAASAADAVQDDDPRLTDDRNPVPHGATHRYDGSDPVSIISSQVEDFTDEVMDAVNNGTIVNAPLTKSYNTTTNQLTLGVASGVGTGDMLKSDYDPDDDQIIDIAQGGTGASTDAGARSNLGLGSAATHPDTDFASATHTHSASAITSGVFAIGRLATGTPTGAKFIRDDGTLAVPPGTGGGGGSGDLLSTNNLSDVASVSTARTNLGLAIGTNVQAYDADLQAIAGLTSAADKGIQFTGSGAAATFDLTTAGKALLDDANAAAQRTTLGLGTAAVKDVPASGDASSSQVVLGNDSRLSLVGFEVINIDATAQTALGIPYAVPAATNLKTCRILVLSSGYTDDIEIDFSAAGVYAYRGKEYIVVNETRQPGYTDAAVILSGVYGDVSAAGSSRKSILTTYGSALLLRLDDITTGSSAIPIPVAHYPQTAVPETHSATVTLGLRCFGRLVLLDTTGGDFTATLPSAAGWSGQRLRIKWVSGLLVDAPILDGDGTETIDGASSYTFAAVGEFIALESDGTNWMVV